jgi:hypothetical protein
MGPLRFTATLHCLQLSAAKNGTGPCVSRVVPRASSEESV